MKITINTMDIQDAMAIAINFLPKEGDYKDKVTISGNNQLISIGCTNYEETILVKNIKYKSDSLDSNFSLSIDAKKLLAALSTVSNDETLIDIEDDYILVKSSRSKVKIECLANTQEVVIEKPLESFDFTDLINMFEAGLHSSGEGLPRYELNGLLLEIRENGFNIVSTDTKRLTKASLNKTNKTTKDLIIPKKGVKNIIKFNHRGIKSFDIGETCLTIHTQNITYSCKLINGKFPEWKKIFQSSYNQVFEVDKHELEKLIHDASIFNSNLIIKIQEKGIEITNFDKTVNVSVDDFIQDSSVNIKFAIDSKMLSEFLKSIKSDEKIKIKFNEQTQPIVFESSITEEVIMPLVA